MTSRRFDDRQVLLWITIAVIVGRFLYLLARILTPFLFAAILAYIGNPLVERTARRKEYLRHLRAKHLGSGVYNARTG